MLINHIKNLKNFIKGYDLILCDLWGVIHNGEKIFPESLEFLHYTKDAGISVILFSNAPRPNTVVRSFLENKIKLSENLFHSIISSGDVALEMINNLNHGKSYFHMGPPKDYDLLDRIKITKTDKIEEADFILCTGLNNDEIENPFDYQNILSEMARLNLPMVCANPDIMAFRGNKKIFCAGSIAEYYSDLGGKVKFYGKPFREMYNHAYKKALNEKIITSKSQILAIGDSVRTDLNGAINFGINSIFIENGIHKNEIISSIDLKNFFHSRLDKMTDQINIINSLKL